MVDDAINNSAFKFLLEKQKKSSKVLHIKYQNLTMQNYLKSKEVNKYQAKFIFSLRSRMLDVGVNYPNKSNSNICPVCKDSNSLDSQQHILVCQQLCENEVVGNSPPVYQDLFKENVSKQLHTSRIIELKFRRRKKLMKKTSQPEKPSEPPGVLQFID